MIDQGSVNNFIEEVSTFIPIYEKEVNVSDPNDLVRFPGFGFWPFWYLEKFKNRRESWETASNTTPPPKEIESEMCDIVSSMYNEEDLYPDIKNYESNKLANSVENSDRTLQGVPEGSFCSPLWDTLSCFPATPVGTIRSIPCMPQIQTVINGETYTTLIDTTKNSSRKCLSNGTWAEKTDYNNCTLLDPHCPPNEPNCKDTSGDYSDVIYMVGYALSLIALTIALVIFLKFREMRCLRNKIHINLFLTFIFTNSWWFASIIIQDHLLHSCTIHVLTSILMRYFHITAFFWMFVEGLFLFLQVIAPLHVTMVKLRHYVLIGWVLPVTVVLLWAILSFLESSSPDDDFHVPILNFTSKLTDEQLQMLNKSYHLDYDSFPSYDFENMYDPFSPSYIPEIHPSNLSFVTPSPESYLQIFSTQSNVQHSNTPIKSTPDDKNLTFSDVKNDLNGQFRPTPTNEVFYDGTSKEDCPFITEESHVRGLKAGAFWIYTGSILILLACNIIFLVWIMKVVISQLKTDTSGLVEQHMKAAKALLVIIPLLGLTQVITLWASPLYGPKVENTYEPIGNQDTSPTEERNYSSLIYLYARALLLSTQGLVITLPYCFLHTEVRTVLRQNIERWRMTRSIGRRSIPTIRMEGIDGDSVNISRIRNHSINGQVTNRIPESTEMSILISPTKSKCSGHSDFNSQNNGYSSENANNPSVIYQNNQFNNKNNDESNPMLCQSNNRFKINSCSNNGEGRNTNNV